MPKAPENLKDIRALVEIVAALRGPDGCPWDLEQNHASLARYALEEAFEMVEALEEREVLRPSAGVTPHSKAEVVAAEVSAKFLAATQKFKEELGDVLFQVALHAQLADEEGAFNFADVVQTLGEKLVRRHPHVFAGVKVNGTADVFANWELVKKSEKAARGESAALISVPAALPALQRAFSIGQKTHKMNFDWAGPQEVWLKVAEEIDELREAMDNDVMSEIEHELGDVLFSLAQLARHYELEPEQVLRVANARFLGRFDKMIAGFAAANAKTQDLDEVLLNFAKLTTDEKEKFWNLAKRS